MSSTRKIFWAVGVLCLFKLVKSQNFVDTAVQEHNKYRSRHGVPNVRSSSDLNQYAQNWADYLASTDKFEHSGGPHGENLYKSWGGTTDKNAIAISSIQAFYNEIEKYDFNNPGFSSETGHFTQVVWKASTEIGVGISTYPDPNWGTRSVVCISYRPPGNYAGQFEQNVPRPVMKALALDDFSLGEEKPFLTMVL